MSKFFGKTAIGLLSTTALFSAVAGVCALESPKTASADGLLDTLIAPTSYEQYLPLDEPTDIAVSEHHTAIADKNFLYIYDRKENEYEKYEHGNGAPESHIKKLQFDDNGTLYFLDGSTSTNFYTFNVETSTETPLNLACGTFVVNGNDLYFTNSTEDLYYADLAVETPTSIALHYSAVSSLAFWNSELYFIQAKLNLTKINPKAGEQSTHTHIKMFTDNISSIAIANGVLGCTTDNGDFSTYALPCRDETSASFTMENGDFTALSAFGDKLYAVQTARGVIKQYDTVQKNFTDFEICANSSAPNRLNGAKALCLSHSRLFIADNQNARISVYDTKAQAFTNAIQTIVAPQFVSADENTLLTANQTQAVLYSVNNDDFGVASEIFTDFEGEITGVASVYGKHYLVTKDNYFYVFEKDEQGAWTRTEIHKASSTRYPSSLTADAYGNLYIQHGLYVYAFTETEFIDENADGNEVFDGLPAQTQAIAVDYERNIYALSENKIYCNDNPTPVDFSTPLVYAQSVTINAFAFGIEENETYLLCDENYIVSSARLSLPTVKQIPVENVDEEIFSEQSATVSVVQTHENALFIAFDLNALPEKTHFPYLYTERKIQPQTALKIGSADKYALIAVFNEEQNKYDTYLVLNSACKVLETNEYSKTYETPQTAYITSDVYLYKFPYLTELLTVTRLQRNATVYVLGEVNKLDNEYYHISYTDETGTKKTGYVPKSYASEIDGATPESEEITYGAKKSNGDAVWRLAYLILGFALVCILVDYLILRKKNNKF